VYAEETVVAAELIVDSDAADVVCASCFTDFAYVLTCCPIIIRAVFNYITQYICFL